MAGWAGDPKAEGGIAGMATSAYAQRREVTHATHVATEGDAAATEGDAARLAAAAG